MIKTYTWKNRIFTLLAAILLLFTFAGCEKKDKTDYVAKGYEQLGVPNYVDAMASFETAIANGSDLTKAYRGLGICHMYFGEYEDAIDDFTNALHESGAYPKDIDFDINYYMGICYHKTGDYQAAKERYDSIIELRPKETDAYIMRGTELLYLNEIDLACKDFDKALSLNKKDYSLYIDIYNILAETGNRSRGVDYLNEVLEKEDRKLSEYDKGYINYCLGNYSTAKNYLEQARTGGNNKGSDTLLLLGRCYEELNDTAFAVNLYESYLNNNPDAKVYNQLAVALIKVGRYDDALEAVVNGIELDSNECRQQLLFNRVVVYEHLGDFDKARDLATQYLEDYPSDEEMAREYEFLKTR